MPFILVLQVLFAFKNTHVRNYFSKKMLKKPHIKKLLGGSVTETAIFIVFER